MSKAAVASRVYCGIDVSAARLSVAVRQRDRDGYEQREFANSAAGQRQLIGWLRKGGAGVRVSLEATGIYSLDVALSLDGAEGIEVAVLNPKTVNRCAWRGDAGDCVCGGDGCGCGARAGEDAGQGRGRDCAERRVEVGIGFDCGAECGGLRDGGARGRDSGDGVSAMWRSGFLMRWWGCGREIPLIARDKGEVNGADGLVSCMSYGTCSQETPTHTTGRLERAGKYGARQLHHLRVVLSRRPSRVLHGRRADF